MLALPFAQPFFSWDASTLLVARGRLTRQTFVFGRLCCADGLSVYVGFGLVFKIKFEDILGFEMVSMSS